MQPINLQVGGCESFQGGRWNPCSVSVLLRHEYLQLRMDYVERWTTLQANPLPAALGSSVNSSRARGVVRNVFTHASSKKQAAAMYMRDDLSQLGLVMLGRP